MTDPLSDFGQSLGQSFSQAGTQVGQGVVQAVQQAIPDLAQQAQQALQPAVQGLAQTAGQAAGQSFGQSARQGALTLSWDDPTTWMLAGGALVLLAGVGAMAYYGGRSGRGAGVNAMRSSSRFHFDSPEDLIAWLDRQERQPGGLHFTSAAEMREFAREAARLGFEFRTTVPGGPRS